MVISPVDPREAQPPDRAPAFAALAVLAISLVSGCGGAVPATRFYVIDYELESPSANQPLDLVLGIEPFSTQPLYRDRRIAHRASEHEVVFYPYSYWAAAPGELVADRLAHHVRRVRVVRAVEVAPFVIPPDWMLSGHVLEFEEVARGGTTVARLELALRLESLADSKVLSEKEIAVEKPVGGGRGPERIAAAMSDAVREAGDQVVQMIQQVAPQP